MNILSKCGVIYDYLGLDEDSYLDKMWDSVSAEKIYYRCSDMIIKETGNTNRAVSKDDYLKEVCSNIYLKGESNE